MADVRLANFEMAAKAISGADYLLIGAGAGCSADSGLAVFAQVSSHPALVKAGLTYDQVACLDMLAKDTPLFTGFWLDALQRYERSTPHEGYTILRRWSEHVVGVRSCPTGASHGSTFVLTSNVDSYFHRSGFPAESVAELHGALRNWQCGGVPNRSSPFPLFQRSRCSDRLFAAPNPRPLVDASTLRASSISTCPHCSDGVARPNVYLFGDGSNFVDGDGLQRYKVWSEGVLSELRTTSDSRLAIVEIGCGLRVPKVRKMTEQLLTACPQSQAALIRINPEYADNPIVCHPTVSLSANGIDAIREIDSLLQAT